MQDKKLIIRNEFGSLLHDGVDHIIVVNQNGRAESVFSKSKTIISKERQEIFFMGFRLHHSLLREFDDELGPVGYFVVHRDNIKLVSVPFDLYNVIMMMKNDTDHESLIDKIKEIHESYNIAIQESEPIYAEAIASGK